MGGTRTFQTGVLAFGYALTVGVGIINSAVLARVLSPHDYGTFRQTLLVFLVVGPVLSLGLPTALSYFLPGETRRARAVVYENLLLLVGLGAAFGLLLLAGGNRWIARGMGNPDLVATLAIMVPFAALSLPWASFSTCLVANGQPVRFAVANVISRLLLLLCVLVPSLVWRSAEAAIAGTVVATALSTAPALVLMLRSCRPSDARPHWAGLRAQLRYAAPLGAVTMFGMLSITLDKLIVSHMCSPETFAVYVNGAMELPIVGVVMTAATAVLVPAMAALFKVGRAEEMLTLWRRACVKCAVVILPAMAVLLALALPFIRLLYSSRYVESTLPFIVYLLMLPGRTVVFSVVFLATGRTGFLFVRSLVAVALNLALSVVLIPHLGYIGAAVAAVLTLYLYEIPVNLMLMRRFTRIATGVHLLVRDLGRILAASLLAALPVATLAFWLPLGDALMLLVGGAVFAVCLVPLLQRLGYLPAGAPWAPGWRIWWKASP